MAPSTPAANQRCASRSSTRRLRCSGIGPSGPKRPKSTTETRAGAAVAAGGEAGHVAEREAQAQLLGEAGRLAVGPPGAAEEPPVALELPEELEEVHVGGGGRQTRLRLPSVIGHGTSSWLCRSLVRVCTKAFTAA